jgi:hypothetical protein
MTEHWSSPVGVAKLLVDTQHMTAEQFGAYVRLPG